MDGVDHQKISGAEWKCEGKPSSATMSAFGHVSNRLCTLGWKSGQQLTVLWNKWIVFIVYCGTNIIRIMGMSGYICRVDVEYQQKGKYQACMSHMGRQVFTDYQNCR